MGSYINSPDLGAFTGQLNKKGLDLARCKFTHEPGYFQTATATNLRAGQAVDLATGLVVSSNGTAGHVFGFVKWGKENLGTAMVVDEPIVFATATATVNLKHANVVAASFQLNPVQRLAGGAQFTVTTDFTVNLVNGTISRVAAVTAPVIGATSYFSYAFNMTAADLMYDGTSFRNQNNDFVTGQENRVVVITGWAQLFSADYDPAPIAGPASFTVGGPVYVDGTGRLTRVVGGGLVVGQCIQIPSADDPYLGFVCATLPL